MPVEDTHCICLQIFELFIDDAILARIVRLVLQALDSMIYQVFSKKMIRSLKYRAFVSTVIGLLLFFCCFGGSSDGGFDWGEGKVID